MRLRLYLPALLVFLGVCFTQAQSKLWGVTSAGVADNKGVIFNTNTDGTGYAVQYNFVTDFPGTTPQNTLALANGKLYGLTSGGGANDQGLIFEFDPVGNTYTKKFDFSPANGTFPQGGLMLASNGHLFGMTTNGGTSDLGVLFEYDPVGNVFTKRYDFTAATGSFPQGNIMEASNGKLYGMTPSGGTNGAGVLFEYDPATFVFTKKVDFAAGLGTTPRGDLVEASNNKLYGLTSGGGANSVGVLFEYIPGGSSIVNKVDFSSASTGSNPNGSLVVAGNGKLYGMTSNGGSSSAGTLFEYIAGSTVVNKLFDLSTSIAANPQGALVQAANGNLYGLGFNGGTANEGTVFEFNPSLNTLTLKFQFSYAVTGGNPLSNLINGPGGKLYGMTPYGGPVGFGALFEYVPGGITVTKRLDFSNSSSGSNPQGGLTLGPNGLLYGLASNGGDNSSGILFEYDPVGASYQKKFDFDLVPTGAYPTGALVVAANGKMYGLTPFGGSQGDGVLFEYDPGTFVVTNKFNFTNAINGSRPQGSLLLAANNKMYGMTSQGGSGGNGTLFEFDPASGTLTNKYAFSNLVAGANPKGSLMRAANGKYYGMTNQGGSFGYGVIFEYDVTGNTYTKKIDFTGLNGSYPYGDLTQASNGKLLGMASSGGANSSGVIFEYDPDLNTVTVKHNFLSASTGSNPQGTLTEVAPGALFGMSAMGGSQSSGVLFQYDLAGGSVTSRKDFGGSSGANPLFEALVLVPGKQSQSISFGALPGKSFNDVPFALTATASSGLAVTYTSSDPAIASIAGNMVTIHNFGTVTITASQAGNANFSFAQNVNQALVISRASQTITFGALPAKVFGDAPFALSATASSGLTVTFVSSDPTIASVSGTTVTILKAGTVTITASQAGDASYDPAPNVPQSLVINKKNQTISFVPPAAKIFGDLPFTLVATATSGLSVSFVSSDPTIVSVSASTATILKAGTATITASQPGDGNYNAAPTDQKVVFVTQATQTITFGILPAKAVGDPPFNLTGTASSGLALTYVSSDPSIASISGSTVTILKAGSINISAQQPGNVNFLAATSVLQALTINKGNQTITFGPIPGKSTTDLPFNLTATASSGLSITYVSSNPSVATVSGSTVSIQRIVGNTTITASQLGNSDYNAATPVNQVLSVTTKLSQTITFGPLPIKKFGDNPFAITATASSGLPVSFVSSNTSVATVTGNLVFIVGPGTTTITASQSGDGTYNPAPTVNQDLIVNKGDQVITFSALPAKKLGDPPFNLTASTSSGLTVSYASSNPAVATVSGNQVTIIGLGATVITASQAGNASFNAAAPVNQDLAILITGDLPDPVLAVTVYPNPAKEKLWVDLHEFATTPVSLKVTDMTGRSFLMIFVGGGEVTEISVAEHPPGMYLLNVWQGTKSRSVKYIKY